MAAMSDYLEARLIDFLFRGNPGSFTAPSALHIALYTTAPTDAGGGVEVSGGGYARATYNASTTNWANVQASGTGVSSGPSAQTSNSAPINFNAPTAAWGTIVAFGIHDAATAGNLLWWGLLSANKSVGANDAPPSFLAGALTITLDT
jgi:hypothetical protein